MESIRIIRDESFQIYSLLLLIKIQYVILCIHTRCKEERMQKNCHTLLLLAGAGGGKKIELSSSGAVCDGARGDIIILNI